MTKTPNNTPKENADKAADRLRREGWFSDEHSFYTGHEIENNIKGIQDNLEHHGHTGFDLQVTGGWSDDYGHAVYIAYDENKINKDRSLEVLKEHFVELINKEASVR